MWNTSIIQLIWNGESIIFIASIVVIESTNKEKGMLLIMFIAFKQIL